MKPYDFLQHLPRKCIKMKYYQNHIFLFRNGHEKRFTWGATVFVSPALTKCEALKRFFTTGYLENMISYIRVVIFVPSDFTTGAVAFSTLTATSLRGGIFVFNPPVFNKKCNDWLSDHQPSIVFTNSRQIYKLKRTIIYLYMKKIDQKYNSFKKEIRGCLRKWSYKFDNLFLK